MVAVAVAQFPLDSGFFGFFSRIVSRLVPRPLYRARRAMNRGGGLGSLRCVVECGCEEGVSAVRGGFRAQGVFADKIVENFGGGGHNFFSGAGRETPQSQLAAAGLGCSAGVQGPGKPFVAVKCAAAGAHRLPVVTAHD